MHMSTYIYNYSLIILLIATYVLLTNAHQDADIPFNWTLQLLSRAEMSFMDRLKKGNPVHNAFQSDHASEFSLLPHLYRYRSIIMKKYLSVQQDHYACNGLTDL
jgi:hypothetical protein